VGVGLQRRHQHFNEIRAEGGGGSATRCGGHLGGEHPTRIRALQVLLVSRRVPAFPCQSGWRSERCTPTRRPPGHHNGCNEALEAAERDSFRFASHGGCLLNETAVALAHLRHLHSRGGSSSSGGGAARAGVAARAGEARRPLRAAVLDLDVHFGDGTAWQVSWSCLSTAGGTPPLPGGGDTSHVSGAASRQLVVPHRGGTPAGRVVTPASPGRPSREGEAGHSCVSTAVPR
jgi:hypothetical protein